MLQMILLLHLLAVQLWSRARLRLYLSLSLSPSPPLINHVGSIVP